MAVAAIAVEERASISRRVISDSEQGNHGFHRLHGYLYLFYPCLQCDPWSNRFEPPDAVSDGDFRRQAFDARSAEEADDPVCVLEHIGRVGGLGDWPAVTEYKNIGIDALR